MEFQCVDQAAKLTDVSTNSAATLQAATIPIGAYEDLKHTSPIRDPELVNFGLLSRKRVCCVSPFNTRRLTRELLRKS